MDRMMRYIKNLDFNNLDINMDDNYFYHTYSVKKSIQDFQSLPQIGEN